MFNPSAHPSHGKPLKTVHPLFLTVSPKSGLSGTRLSKKRRPPPRAGCTMLPLQRRNRRRSAIEPTLIQKAGNGPPRLFARRCQRWLFTGSSFRRFCQPVNLAAEAISRNIPRERALRVAGNSLANTEENAHEENLSRCRFRCSAFRSRELRKCTKIGDWNSSGHWLRGERPGC
jgi:hypothetical protein